MLTNMKYWNTAFFLSLGIPYQLIKCFNFASLKNNLKNTYKAIFITYLKSYLHVYLKILLLYKYFFVVDLCICIKIQR
jgi:hypothetical protein